MNEAKVGGAVVATAFPGNPTGCKDPKYWFWAAEASKVGGTAWGLSSCDGFTGYNVGASGDWNYFPTANVRCVRNGPWGFRARRPAISPRRRRAIHAS